VRKILGILLLAALCSAGTAHAVLNIEITEGMEGALPIAVVPFGWTGPAPLPQDVAAVVSSDLARSGRFAPMAAERLPARPMVASQVDYSAWRSTGAESLVIGRVQPREGGAYVVEFQLLDIPRGQQLVGYSIPANAQQLRRVAHQISDIIYEKLTGERGAFDTNISYVTEERAADGKRTYRLAVADSDAYNEQIILTSTQPIMSPAWSPDGRRLAYVSFEEGRSAVFVQEVATGKREKVASHPGINSAPAWSPDGRSLALTLSRDGNAEIYVLDLASKRLQRVTNSFAIDTEPAWSPDGRELVFTSDRGGRPQIYRLAMNGGMPMGSPERVTFEGSYNARARFSPDGRRITMVTGEGNRFRIAVMDLDTGNLRVLTESRLDESPSFSPNGAMIIYATEIRGRGVLEAVAADGRAHQRLGLSRGDVREPAWSPFFK
jgi:TolB protein